MANQTTTRIKPIGANGPIELNVDTNQPVDIVISDLHGNEVADQVSVTSAAGTTTFVGANPMRVGNHMGTQLVVRGFEDAKGEKIVVSFPRSMADRTVVNVRSSTAPVRIEGLKADGQRPVTRIRVGNLSFKDSVVNGRDISLTAGTISFLGTNTGRMIECAAFENVYVEKGDHFADVTGNASLHMKVTGHDVNVISERESEAPHFEVSSPSGMDTPAPVITGMAWVSNRGESEAQEMTGNLAMNRNQISIDML